MGTVKTLVTRHLQHASNLQTRRQKVFRRVSAFPSRYKIGPGDVLDLINWYTQFPQLSTQKLSWRIARVFKVCGDKCVYVGLDARAVTYIASTRIQYRKGWNNQVVCCVPVVRVVPPARSNVSVLFVFHVSQRGGTEPLFFWLCFSPLFQRSTVGTSNSRRHTVGSTRLGKVLSESLLYRRFHQILKF